MKTFEITTVPGFEQWRLSARKAIQAGLPPHEVTWSGSAVTQYDLFVDTVTVEPEHPVNCEGESRVHVSQRFLQMARIAICHNSSERFALLYRVLWRLVYENRSLLSLKTDNDMIALNRLIKQVHRDAYKITAFLRFRELKQDDESVFVAWYEPEHYTLELKLPFFHKRFKNMQWFILTPYRSAFWDGSELQLEDNPDPAIYPSEDDVEHYWLTYYANIFNPARIKREAMLSQMPKKYWKNMPETALIPEMLKNAEHRARRMISESKNVLKE